MTAQTLIENLENTTLTGIKIGDGSVGNRATLLQLLNFAKNKIAEDTLLWIGGEEVTMVTDVSSYTLSVVPIQIVDVFDGNNIIRPRNSSDDYGYYQTSPNEITFNKVSNNLKIKINYYTSTSDYILIDEINVPSTLLVAIQYYIAHKAFEIYKSDSDVIYSKEYYNKYVGAIQDYKANSDSVDVDTVVSGVNKIWLRGIR